MKLGRTRRRALSTVVTSGILLSAVAIMGSGLVTWSNSSFTVHQNELEQKYSDNLNKLSESAIVENIWFGNNPSKFLNVTITNVGDVGLNVTKIKISDSVDSLETTITDGGLATKTSFSKQMMFDWKDDEPIDVVVTTGRTSIFNTQVMAP